LLSGPIHRCVARLGQIRGRVFPGGGGAAAVFQEGKAARPQSCGACSRSGELLRAHCASTRAPSQPSGASPPSKPKSQTHDSERARACHAHERERRARAESERAAPPSAPRASACFFLCPPSRREPPAAAAQSVRCTRRPFDHSCSPLCAAVDPGEWLAPRARTFVLHSPQFFSLRGLRALRAPRTWA